MRITSSRKRRDIAAASMTSTGMGMAWNGNRDGTGRNDIVMVSAGCRVDGKDGKPEFLDVKFTLAEFDALAAYVAKTRGTYEARATGAE